MTLCVGVIVVTTVGANICTNEIISEAAKENSNGEHPEYVSIALSFSRYRTAVITKNWDLIADLILESINRAKAAGADFAIIPSNTPHYGFSKIQKYSPIPVLNLIELTVNECKEKGYTRVAVLGTRATMQGDLYTSKLVAAGIQPVIPDEETYELIDKLIMDDLILIKPDFTLREEVSSRIQKLDCDAVILGCTELPEIYNTKNIGKPAIDTTRLLAQIALKHATHCDLFR